MVSVKESFSTSKSVPRITNYHFFASRYLQKQFVHACVCVFLSCYVVSYILGRQHSFGQLLPWTSTGLRALVLFFATFPLALVRKANLRGASTQIGSLTYP